MDYLIKPWANVNANANANEPMGLDKIYSEIDHIIIR